MPYDAAGPVVTPGSLPRRGSGPREALVDVALLGYGRPGPARVTLSPLVEAGVWASSSRCSCTHPGRFPRIPDAQFVESCSRPRAAGHRRLRPRRERGADQAAPRVGTALGDASPHRHCRSRPPVSETQAVLTAPRVRSESPGAPRPLPSEPSPIGRPRRPLPAPKACR